MEKRIKIIVIIGIVLLVAAPILGFILDKLLLFSAAPVTIQEDSDSDIQDAFAFPVSLAKNQKLVVEFSVYYADIQATVKILGKGAYDAAYAINQDPDLVSGLSFVYSEFTYGISPQSSADDATSLSITDDGYWYIEFAGSVYSSDYVISRPGDYVVVVYGTNTGAPTDVYFNITIKADGPGNFLQNLFLAVGIIILACYALYFSYGYLNKLRRGVD
jgi:hypothetical protein